MARQLVKLGGRPEYRQGVVTDNGNVILDVHGTEILDAIALENAINGILALSPWGCSPTVAPTWR